MMTSFERPHRVPGGSQLPNIGGALACADGIVADARVVPRAGRAPSSNALGMLRAVAVRAIDVLFEWQERARQRYRLETLDDHLLKDLGLSRADVSREVSKPFWRP